MVLTITGSIILITVFSLISCATSDKIEVQLTFDTNKNHDLDNNDNFSPDDRWLVYDTRTEIGGIGECRTIEKVNVKTGEIVVLYETQNAGEYGPGVGAVSYSHTENKAVFIHGLLNCNAVAQKSPCIFQ